MIVIEGTFSTLSILDENQQEFKYEYLNEFNGFYLFIKKKN